MKTKNLAGVLAILFGGVGVQHFYLGNYLSALLSVLFCWTGLPLLYGIFHGIGLLAMGETEFNAKYNYKYVMGRMSQ